MHSLVSNARKFDVGIYEIGKLLIPDLESLQLGYRNIGEQN